ncbi:hypothetical protein EI53_00138 [Fusobacterium naviforme]|nr:hypothetical protein EI53_00138 [Fusobacterium naviforme]STO28487.1 Uncharacterised protein [Fusobacterium naviforme]
MFGYHAQITGPEKREDESKTYWVMVDPEELKPGPYLIVVQNWAAAMWWGNPNVYYFLKVEKRYAITIKKI